MKKLLIFILLTLSILSLAATKYLQGDSIKSANLSKTYTFSGTQGSLITAQSVSGDMTAVASGDLTNFQLTTASFHDISPTTTKGDLIVRNSSTNVRLAVGASTDMTLLVSSDASSGVVWGFPISSFSGIVNNSGVVVSPGTTKVTGFSVLQEQGNAVVFSTGSQRFNINKAAKYILKIYAECSMFDGTVTLGYKINAGSYQAVLLAAGQSSVDRQQSFYGDYPVSLAVGDYVEIFYDTSLSRTCQRIRAILTM